MESRSDRAVRQRRHAGLRRRRFDPGRHRDASGLPKARIVIAVFGLLAGGLAYLDAGRMSCPPIELVAHRGIAPVESENTHQAFSTAQRLGFRMIETDVRITSDGAFVLMHDTTLLRTTARPERVSELRLDLLRKLRTRGGNPIPTLGDLLRWAHAHDMRVLVELKHDPRLPWTSPHLRSLLQMVDRFNMTDQVTFLSFHKSDMQAIERLDRSRRTAWIIRKPPAVARMAATVDKVFVPSSMASAEFVHEMHRAGVQVSGRTTQRVGDLRALARAGVIEIITDQLYPHAARDSTRALQSCVIPRGGWR